SATLFLLWSALVALTPNCPFCFFVVIGASGAVGAAAAAWMPAVMIVSLAISVAAVFARSRMERRYGAAIFAVLAAIAIVVGKFVIQSSAVVYGGAALFVAAVFQFAMERIRWHKPLVW